MTPEDLAVLRELDAARTQGEWFAGDTWVYTMSVYPDDTRLSSVLGMTFADEERRERERQRAQANAEFIAALANHASELLDATYVLPIAMRAQANALDVLHQASGLPEDTEDIDAMYEIVLDLPAEVTRLRQERLEFSASLGFGDGRTEPAATLPEMLDPIQEAFSAQRNHFECPMVCEGCGETLARTICEDWHGSGCGHGTSLGAYSECEWCAVADKVHEGCVEQSYADLAAEVTRLRAELAEARAAIERVREIHRPIRVYEECAHDADHGCKPVEVYDYMGCSESQVGWGCSVCCYDDEYPREDCPHGAIHDGVTREQACPTTAALANPEADES